MKITITAVGGIKEKYLRDAIDEYMKRLRPFAKIEIKEIVNEKMSNTPSKAEKEQTLLREGEKLLKAVSPDAFLFVLDVKGAMLTSEELSAKIDSIALNGKSEIVFVIGGTFGIGENLRKTADFCLSFSKMTFTHQMIRVLLLEQIYRSFKISRGEKYHW